MPVSMNAWWEVFAAALQQSDGVGDVRAGDMFLLGIEHRQCVTQKIEHFAQSIAICSINHRGPRLNCEAPQGFLRRGALNRCDDSVTPLTWIKWRNPDSPSSISGPVR